MRFEIIIELGNSAMQSRTHIAEAIRKVATRILTPTGSRHTGDEGIIMDVNGNSVGTWKFVE